MTAKFALACRVAATIALIYSGYVLPSAHAQTWIEPTVVVEANDSLTDVIPGEVKMYGGKLVVSFAIFGSDRESNRAGVAWIDRATGAHSVVVSAEGLGAYVTGLVPTDSCLLLVWERYAGKLPDGFDTWQILVGVARPDTISSVRVLMDSVWTRAAFCGCCDVGYVVATQSYYGAPYLDSSWLLRIDRQGLVRRFRLPHGEWDLPSVWCAGENNVYVAGWAGDAVNIARSADGGVSWEWCPAPPKNAPVKNLVGTALPDGRILFLWNENRCGGMFPDAFLACFSSNCGGWQEAAELEGTQYGCDRWPGPGDVAPLFLRREGWGAVVVWTTDVWDTPETWLSVWSHGQWHAPKRVFEGWGADGYVANCRIATDPANHLYLVGTLRQEAGGDLIFTKSLGTVTGVDQSEHLNGPSRTLPLVVMPSPFNTGTTVRYATETRVAATMRVFDLRGNIVRTLLKNAWQSTGEHTVRWDGRDDAGRLLPSGVYIVRLEAGGQVATRKVVLVR